VNEYKGFLWKPKRESYLLKFSIGLLLICDQTLSKKTCSRKQIGLKKLFTPDKR
jgi:hypothetical protein